MKLRSAEWFAGRDEIGPQSRSVLRTLGWTPEFFTGKPVIGIANSWSELNNCNLGLRALAEAENTRRRAQRDIEENSKYAISGFARDILPVADNLRRAIESVSSEARQADERLDKFVAGVELTEREFLAILERHGIQRFDPTGQPFDHNFHQAMMQVDSPTHAPGTVVQVFQAGYTIHGRLLRPAMVTVAKGSGAEATGARVDTSA